MAASTDKLWQRAQRYLAQGQMAPARAMMESLGAIAPADVRTHLVRAAIAWSDDCIRDASRHALAAAAAQTADPALSCDVVETLWYTGEVAAMREYLAQPALSGTRDGMVLTRLSDFHQRLDAHAEALVMLDRARDTGTDGPEIRFHQGVEFAINGQLDRAEAELDACLAMAPTHGRAALALARLRKATPTRNHLAAFQDGLREVRPGTQDQAALEFGLYKELEDLQHHAEAWQALARGNALMDARNRFDAMRQRHHLDHFIKACTPEALRVAEGAQLGPTPIFVLGLTRSGTTVLDRVLGNHSRIASAGELGDFERQLHWVADHGSVRDPRFLECLAGLDYAEVGRRYLAQTWWRAHDKPFYVDKQPPNWMLAGLIHAALPQARILHLVREPMDVCFSNWRAFFGDDSTFSYNLEALAMHYRDYRRLMAHWHAIAPGAILDVSYAGLVRNPEATAREVLAFCGLEWESGCIDLTRNQAPVATLSLSQVRQPIHVRAFGEWQPYAEQLSGLRAALDAIAGAPVTT